MGAEPYVVRNCKSKAVAEKFLGTVKWFREWTSWHGHSAEGNPSGGNKFRGKNFQEEKVFQVEF